jgi:hypothetical protein
VCFTFRVRAEPADHVCELRQSVDGIEIGDSEPRVAPTSICSPASRPPSRRDQHQAGDGGDDAVLAVHARQPGLVTWQEGGQLVRGHKKIHAGQNKKDHAEENKDELYVEISFCYWSMIRTRRPR